MQIADISDEIETNIPLFTVYRLLPLLVSFLVGAPFVSAAFSDVPGDNAFKEAIEYVQGAGIVSGYSNGTFQPENEINRAEFTKIIVGSAFGEESGSTEQLFRDVKGSEWFAPYIEKAVDEEIIEGYGEASLARTSRSFFPTFRINYAEAAKIIVLSMGVQMDLSLSADGEWWEQYTDALEKIDALPRGWGPTKTVTRGEMAEMIYRIKTGQKSTHSDSVSALDREDKLNFPILVYHHVREQQGWDPSTWSWKMTVSPSIFEKHMKWLLERGYTTMDMDTMVAILNGQMAGPVKPVVITFDDNNLNAYEAGAPIMEKYGHTATFYQMAKQLENHDAIDTERTKDLVKRGFDIQSHTMMHRALPALSVEEIDWEFTESKKILEEVTGKPVRHVAYPGTAHNATVRERARLAGYVTGTLMDPRRITDGYDMFKLPRIMMTDTTNLEKVLP